MSNTVNKINSNISSSFVDKLTGFDVIKFDDEVAKASDGQSTRDAVLGAFLCPRGIRL